MYASSSPDFAKDIETLREQINIAHKDLDLINESQSIQLYTLVDEAESLTFSDSPALIRSLLRRKLENQGWTFEEFLAAYSEAFESMGKADASNRDKAFTVAGSALMDVREDQDMTEEDLDDAINQFIAGIHAAIYAVVFDGSEATFAAKEISSPLEAIS